jgi:hypothetical protein
MLGWLLYEHGIEPHVTVFDKSARTDGTFSREDFTYDHEGDMGGGSREIFSAAPQGCAEGHPSD